MAPLGESLSRFGRAGLPSFRQGLLRWRAGGHPHPAARLCFLRADGEMIGPNGEAVQSAGAHLLVLARGLCRFHLFPALPGAPRARTEAAAEIYCEAQAPFETSDSLKLRTPRGVAIWSWDRARVRESSGVYYRDRILPESLVYPPGEGWCQRACVDGFEAQYWEDGVLLASMWRRRPFDAEQWAQFAAEVLEPNRPAPAVAPEPETFALPSSIRSTPPRVRRRWGWPELERAVAAVALLAAGFGAYHYGQSLQYERMAAADLAALERGMAANEADPSVRAALGDLEMARAFARLGNGNAPLAAAAEAFSILGGYGLTIVEWSADDIVFQARISPVPDLALVRDAASVMENHPLFANVSSQSDKAGDMLVIQAELTGRGGSAPPPAVIPPEDLS